MYDLSNLLVQSAPRPFKMVELGRANCIKKTEVVIERCTLGQVYTYQKLLSPRDQHYFRVYPNPDSDQFETCGILYFARHFKIVTYRRFA